ALISFLFAAFCAAAPEAGAQPGQQAEPKTESPAPAAGTGAPVATAEPTQPAPKPKVPATNGRASSASQSPTAILDGPIVQPFIDDDKPQIIHSDLITLTVTVTDTYGRFVTGLNKNAFTILDDKTQQ